ncbi:MAG TPA: S41 family peptidase [Candidatus Polarisedimenticolaceae bacterium]|nr:S41 family peptidase [Candidatus Polarisedimenticolaceae bacterium]
MRAGVVAGLALSAGLVLGGAGAAETAAPSGAETFDAAWTIVRDTHFDPGLNGVDWDAVRAELRPKAESASSAEELRGILSDMLGRLGQSHFAIFPQETVDRLESFRVESVAPAGAPAASEPPGSPEVAGPTAEATAGDVGHSEEADEAEDGSGVVGLEVRLLDGRVVVTRVEADYAAAEQGVRPGWLVTRIDDRDVVELIEFVRGEMAGALYGEQVIVAEVVAEALNGPPGSTIDLGFVDGDGATVERTLERRAAKGRLVRFGNLPPMMTRVDGRSVTTEEDQRVGIVSLSSWMVPAMAELDRLLFEFRDVDGVVFDLRGNPGGVAAMVMGTAGHFIDQRVDLGTMRMRTSSLRFAVNPRLVDGANERVGVFDGPLAILVDGLSASTSEVFAGGMQDVGRARVFGETTMGAVLPAQMERLPNGDVLYHAFAEYVTPSGVALEGRGVVPDESVRLTRAALLDGRDPQLDAAVRWIVIELNRAPAPLEAASPEEGTQ